MRWIWLPFLLGLLTMMTGLIGDMVAQSFLKPAKVSRRFRWVSIVGVTIGIIGLGLIVLGGGLQ